MSSRGTEDRQSQRDRFEETARELGVDLDEVKLKEALRRLAPEPKDKRRDKDSSGSDRPSRDAGPS